MKNTGGTVDEYGFYRISGINDDGGREEGEILKIPQELQKSTTTVWTVFLSPPLVQCIPHEIGGVVNIEFLHDIRPVGVDCPDADEELFGDLGVV